jgi:hypothetical protein
MAVEELQCLGEEMFLPFKHDVAWQSHARDLDHCLHLYQTLLKFLQEEVQRLSCTMPGIVLRASLDLATDIRLLVNDCYWQSGLEMITRYSSDGHPGIAYILHMKRLMCYPQLRTQEAGQFLDYRSAFLRDVEIVLGKSTLILDAMEGLELHDTQLFVPSAIYRIPSVRVAMHQDGRKDYLLRSMHHLAHDAAIPLPEANADDEYAFRIDESSDIIGRTMLHLACLRTDLGLLGHCPTNRKRALGLSAWDVAAINGDVRISMMLNSKDPRPFDYRPGHRNCLHWAASCGHHEIVNKLCMQWTADMKKYINDKDRSGDTALHLAARFGHIEVVRMLLKHHEQISFNAYRRHTPFWSAVSGSHLEVMEMLEPFSNVDEDEAGGLTPLAEAARNGFTEGVRYLLGLNCSNVKRVDPNSLNSCWNAELKKSELKTSLDLAIESNQVGCIELIKANEGVTWERLTFRHPWIEVSGNDST